MVLQKSQLLAVVMIVVVVASYAAQKVQNAAQIKKGNEATHVEAMRIARAAFEGCKSRAAADAYEAALGTTLRDRVRARNAPGDRKSAKLYEASARSVGMSLARPTYLKTDDVLKMVQTELVEQIDGTYRLQLTETARKLISDGCAARYLK